MAVSRQTLKKREILRGQADFQRLLTEGQRVRGRGVTLFFYHRPKGVSE